MTKPAKVLHVHKEPPFLCAECADAGAVLGLVLGIIHVAGKRWPKSRLRRFLRRRKVSLRGWCDRYQSRACDLILRWYAVSKGPKTPRARRWS